jgi:hypothetical protein
MEEKNLKDETMAHRVGTLMPGEQVLPKHVRMAGGYCLFAACFFAGVNAYAWQRRELWPSVLVITPAVLLFGLWLLFDGNALARGTRSQQRIILWACILVGCGLGEAIHYQLTGRF